MTHPPSPRPPSGQPKVTTTLERLYEELKNCKDGDVATYIPELAKVDPDKFAISLVLTDGRTFSIGDNETPFTIQSISKPVVYGLALETHSPKGVIQRIGVEPTGDAFDAILKLDKHNKPHNPMVNAGAIAATDMVPGETPSARLEKLYNVFANYIGRRPMIDTKVYTSESDNGNRNKALGYLLLNFGNINHDVHETLELYFQQCSLQVTTEDLAMIGATFANGGINPHTGDQAIRPEYIRDVLSIMLTCGMYDYSGEWVFNIGMPAKSSIAGGIMMVIPGVGGLGIYSPRLDKYANSVRGIKVCEQLSREVGLHMLDASFDSLRSRALSEMP